MTSCLHGHPVSPGSEFCETCGDDARLRCGQGHRSGAGAQFCETCGELLAASQAHPGGREDAGAPVLDYRSGSFTDFILSGQADLAGPDVKASSSTPPMDLPLLAFSPAPEPDGSQPVGAAERLPEPWRDAHADVLASLPPYGERGSPPLPGRPRRRARALTLTLALLVLAVAGTAGALTLLRHHASAPQAGTAPQRDGAPGSASPAGPARPTGRPAPALPVRSSGWTAPVPIDQTAQSATNAVITGLSCPRVTVCYAVDSSGNILSSTSRSAAARGTWQVVASDQGSGLVAISCPTAGFCLAVDKAGDAITMSNGSWGSPAYVDARTGTFTSVSCPLTTFCMAADSGGNAFAYTAASNTWQPFTVDTSGGGLTGVSCTGPDHCVAVDTGGGAYTYDGSSWSAAVPVDVGHAFTVVSCASPSFCAAADDGGNGAILTRGSWKVAAIGTTIGALACPADGFCLAAAGSGGAVAYHNGAWSAVTRIDGQRVVGALSCPAPTACTAADRQDNVLYYAPPPSG